MRKNRISRTDDAENFYPPRGVESFRDFACEIWPSTRRYCGVYVSPITNNGVPRKETAT